MCEVYIILLKMKGQKVLNILFYLLTPDSTESKTEI